MNLAAKIWGAFAANHNSRPGVNSMATVAKIAPKAKSETGTVQWFRDHIELGKTVPHAEVGELTPGLAGVILANNPDNRNITQVKLRHYVSAMRKGLWPLNGETIIFSKEGMLNDGQHRCLAVIEANVTVPATFFFGADRDTRTTVDMGAARTAAHLLGMEGLTNSALRGAIARWLLAYEDGDGKTVGNVNSYSSFDNYQRARNDVAIGEAASFLGSHLTQMKMIGLQPAVAGAALYIFRNICEQDADAFLTRVIVGENIARGDPAFAARSRLMSMARNPAGRFEVLLRGWNAHRQGRKIMSITTNGILPELV